MRKYPLPQEERAQQEAAKAAPAPPSAFELLSADDKLSVAEIAFREAHDAVREQYGIALSHQSLNVKKRAFERELANRKAKLPAEIRRIVQGVSNDHYDKLFEQGIFDFPLSDFWIPYESYP